MGYRNGKLTDRIKEKRIYVVSYRDIYGKTTLTWRRLANETLGTTIIYYIAFFLRISTIQKKKAAAYIYTYHHCVVKSHQSR